MSIPSQNNIRITKRKNTVHNFIRRLWQYLSRAFWMETKKDLVLTFFVSKSSWYSQLETSICQIDIFMDRKIGEEIPLTPLLKQGKINKGKKNIRKKKQQQQQQHRIQRTLRIKWENYTIAGLLQRKAWHVKSCLPCDRQMNANTLGKVGSATQYETLEIRKTQMKRFENWCIWEFLVKLRATWEEKQLCKRCRVKEASEYSQS